MEPTVDAELEPGSFRDRKARVFYRGGKVYRALSREACQEWQRLQAAPFFRTLQQEGKLVATRAIPDPPFPIPVAGSWAGLLEHARIPFLSYPYEWSFSMLKEAALLQLELLGRALRENFTLKDSSPYNFQWSGVHPLFIDLLSFEPLPAGEPWTGYRQFCELFLYPLLLQAYKDLPFHGWLRGRVDGITARDCDAIMSWRDRLRPGVFTHVYLQNRFQQRFGSRPESVRVQLRQAGFPRELILRNLRGLEKLLRRLRWKRSASEWSDYMAERSHYQEGDRRQKEEFVRQALSRQRWRLVWDLGCNIGTFSRLAASQADYVVAMDADHFTIERFFLELKERGTHSNILPLVVNIADPSPDLGWRGRERQSLWRRGRPDLTLCLALLHHLVIGANIPVEDLLDWLASLQTALIIEFVSKEDPMVKRLLRNKDDQYLDYEVGSFETSLTRRFEVLERSRLGCQTRILYFARPKPGSLPSA